MCDVPKTRRFPGMKVILVLLGVTLMSGFAGAGDFRSTLEITGNSLTPSFNDDASWGWWNPSKYDVWETEPVDSFELTELRFTVPGDEYSGFFAVEFYPELSGEGIQYTDDGTVAAEDLLTCNITVYDLGLAQDLNLEGGYFFKPWIALSYMQIEERKFPQLAEEAPTDRADSGLWGAGIGLDAETPLPWNLRLAGRLVARWATGDRKATFTPDGSDDLSGTTQVKASDSVDQFMWGAELGVLWNASRYVGLEGGWRYRDWTNADGPATFDGPFLRLRLRL